MYQTFTWSNVAPAIYCYSDTCEYKETCPSHISDAPQTVESIPITLIELDISDPLCPLSNKGEQKNEKE